MRGGYKYLEGDITEVLYTYNASVMRFEQSKGTAELNSLFGFLRPQGAYSPTLSFFPLTLPRERSELDVYRDFHLKTGFSKAVRG